MKTTIHLTIALIAVLACFTSTTSGDVVLTFDQNGAGNGTLIDQDYGDRVTAATDGKGHSYDIITGNGLGFTPNIEVDYSGDMPTLWGSGYSGLDRVLYDTDSSNGFEITLTADAGYEVGLFGFDLGAFSTSQVLPGYEVLDADGNVVLAESNVALPGATPYSVNTGGIYSESMTIAIDLDQLGSNADNFGISNIHFGQRLASVPEPTSVSLLLLGGLGLVTRRSRRS